MDRLDAMRVFVRVLERKSFSQAAQDIGLPASTVTDAVKQLERRLGVRLLQRTTRHVSPTPDGEAYYRRCLSILDDIEDAEASFGAAKPRGLLRLEVQGNLARHYLIPRLPRFCAAYPDIEFHLSEGDRYIDPLREGVDCVLRVGELTDSDMVARRLILLEEITCASPSYIARHGRPRRWDALDGHRMIGFHSSATGGVLPLEFVVDGVRRTVMLPYTVSVNGVESYAEAARQGFGLVQWPRYGRQADIDSGALVTVLEDTPPSPSPVSLLYPRSRLPSPRVRVFIDWITAEFAAER